MLRQHCENLKLAILYAECITPAMSRKVVFQTLGSLLAGGFRSICSRQKMKAYELLHSPRAWCQGSPARNSEGTKVQAFDPSAVRWCALGAIQKIYPKWQWEEKMDRLLRALSVSESGLASLTTADKMCCLMEWNDGSGCSFTEVREILLAADL
jgi:hypothetical protein